MPKSGTRSADHTLGHDANVPTALMRFGTSLSTQTLAN
jgi:hypothetical protein